MPGFGAAAISGGGGGRARFAPTGSAQHEGRDGYHDGANGVARGIVVVKNKNEWHESRKRLKEREERKAKEGRTGDEPAEFGFPMGGFEEQIKRLLEDARHRRGGA